VVRKSPSSIVMVPLGQPRAWGRDGYGARRVGRGLNRMGRQGMS
jgi:hypothetical protein